MTTDPSMSSPRTTVAFFISYPFRMAGANRSLFHLVTNLPAGIRPHVVLAADGPVAQAYRDVGVACTVLEAPGSLGTYGKRLLGVSPLRKAWIAARDLVPYTLRLRAWLRAQGIDILHTNDPRGTLLAGAAARLAGVPVVQHLRGEFPFGRAIRTAYERLGSRTIAVSDGARRTLSPAAAALARTVYNGIGELPPSRNRIPWLEELRGRGVTVVCCFATLIPFKGYHHLVDALARLNAAGWRDRVVVVGVGDFIPEYAEYQQWLLDRMRERGVDNLTFAGWQDDPFAFYRYADVCVLPSVTRETLDVAGEPIQVRGNEGLPRTHLEAMRFGLPIVGTRIAGVPEMVEEGVTGLLVEPGDAAGLADALAALVADRARREEMGRRGRERVERMFSTSAYVAGVVDVYRELLPGRFDRPAAAAAVEGAVV